ncbi:hypothetical protein BST61_g2729 [Cercospora zeina]
MAEKVLAGRISKRSRRRRDAGAKLPPLPPDAKVTKRPLLHPALPSPYAGSSQQKVIYVSTKTPFMSAVKRVEKLLRLSDKRQVQSATQRSKDSQKAKRRSEREADEILGIAKELESAKAKAGDQEQVILKGTGKAISKVMELGLWFQQREEYQVTLQTGTVSAVDDQCGCGRGGWRQCRTINTVLLQSRQTRRAV